VPVATATGAPAPSVSATPSRAPGQLPTVEVDAAAALAAEGRLIDARTAVRFRGAEEPIDPVSGHIPGARNVPAADLIGPDGRLRDPARLRELLATPGGAPAAYCGSGVTAAHTVWAMATIGMPASLYAGSWSDWISDPSRPTATTDR
jgi:thiosulfate/3-mercaptopyruvate sulfurtransferase